VKAEMINLSQSAVALDGDVVAESYPGNPLMLAISDQMAAMRVDLDRSDGSTHKHEEK
jgi:hypothetical protein